MKKIFILQNSNIPYDMHIAALYNPKKYKLYFVLDDLNFLAMKDKGDERYFEDVIRMNVFDIENVLARIKNLIASLDDEMDFVTEAEECVVLCGELRKYFGISEKNYERFINKILMKRLLYRQDIMLPEHILFDKFIFNKNKASYLDSILKKISFPILVKPVDQASCIGVEKIESVDSLKSWCEYAVSSSFEFELDEFIDGELYHCDSFIKDKKILYTQVSRCSRPCFDFMEGKSKGSIVLQPTDNDFIHLTKWTESVLRALSPPDNGVTHLEVFKTNKGEFVFLEIAYRAAGILIPDMYKKYLNIDIITSHLMLQMDSTFNLSFNNGPYAAWMAFPTRQGILDQLNSPNIKSQHELKWYFEKGDLLAAPKKGRDFIATIFLWNKDYSELENDFYYLNDFVLYTIK